MHVHSGQKCPSLLGQERNGRADSAPARGPVAVEVAGVRLVYAGRRLGGHERGSVLVQPSLHLLEDVVVGVQDVVSLLGVDVQIEELIIRTVVPPGVDLLCDHIHQLRGREPAVRVAGITLHQLEAALAEGGVVAHLVHVVEELLTRSRTAAQQVPPLAHAVDVGDGGSSASRLHQGRVPVHDVNQLVVGRVVLLKQPGCVHEASRASAAFPDGDLGSPQGPVGGGFVNGSPVVRGEDNEGVVHQTSLLQRLGDVVHGLVHGGDHPALGPSVRVVDVGAVLVHVPLRNLHTTAREKSYSTERGGTYTRQPGRRVTAQRGEEPTHDSQGEELQHREEPTHDSQGEELQHREGRNLHTTARGKSYSTERGGTYTRQPGGRVTAQRGEEGGRGKAEGGREGSLYVTLHCHHERCLICKALSTIRSEWLTE